MKAGWRVMTFADVAKIFNGNSINAGEKKTKYTNVKDGLPYIGTKDVEIGKIDYDNGVRIPNYENFKIAKANTVLVCAEGGSAGKKVAITDRSICFGNKLFALEPKSNSNGYFLYYYTLSDSFRKEFNAQLTGIIGGVSSKKFNALSIPIPSLPEQERIVKILDAAFEKIDRLKENAEKGLQAVKDLWEGSLVKILCDSKYPQNQLGTTVDFVRGPFGGSLTKNMFKESGYAVYEQQHAIHQHINIRYFIEKSKYDEMERFHVRPGDLIMSCSGVTLGRAIIIPKNAPLGVINQALLKMTTKSNILNEYLLYYIRCKDFQKKIFDYSKGAAIPNVAPVSTLKTIKISLPSVEEQKLIVAKLDKISTICQNLQRNYEQELSEYEALKQSILRKAFSGEL